MSETRHHGRVTLVLDSESDKAEDAAYIMVEGETYTALIIFQYNGVVSGTPLVLTPHEMDWLREQSNAIIAARETVLGERDVMAHVFTRQRHFWEPPVDLPSVEWILNQQQIRNQAAAGFATTADTTTTGFAPAGSPTGRIQTATSNVLPFANIDYSHLEARMAAAIVNAADRPLAVPLPANDEQPFESADPPAGIGDINIQAGEGMEVHQEGNQVTISRAPEHVGVPDYSSPAAVQAFWQRTTGTASFVDYARQLLAETRSDDNSNAAQATRQIGVDLGLTPDVVIEDEIVDTDVGDHADEDYDDS